jgi:putative phosphoesterase
MRLIVFGDIHANIVALERCYQEALRHQPDRIIHLADLGGYAPFVNEVTEFMIEHEIDGVQGNYDFNVAHESDDCGCKYEDPVQADLSHVSFEWTKAHTTPENKKYMMDLPFSIQLTAGDKRIRIFHATPVANNLYWYEERSYKFYRRMAKKAEADVMIFGHTHKPFRRELDSKVFINAGSVGKPKDNNPQTGFVCIDVDEEGIRSRFIRLDYDVEKVASTIIKAGLPPLFAEKLRAGAG